MANDVPLGRLVDSCNPACQAFLVDEPVLSRVLRSGLELAAQVDTGGFRSGLSGDGPLLGGLDGVLCLVPSLVCPKTVQLEDSIGRHGARSLGFP